MPRRTMSPRNPERGSAMLVTMIIIASLLAGAVVLVSMQLSSSRSTDLSRSSTAAMYCAEAGLHAARAIVGTAETSDINAAIAASNGGAGTLTEPSWLSTGIGVHDANGDGVGGDYHVYIKDDDDEVANGATNNPQIDINSKVWVVSICDIYPETPQALSELLDVSKENATLYDWQAGGAFGNGNYNFMQVTQ